MLHMQGHQIWLLCSPVLHLFIHTALERWHGPINEGLGLNQLLQSDTTLFLPAYITNLHYRSGHNCAFSSLPAKIVLLLLYSRRTQKLNWYYLLTGLQNNQGIWLLCLVQEILNIQIIRTFRWSLCLQCATNNATF